MWIPASEPVKRQYQPPVLTSRASHWHKPFSPEGPLSSKPFIRPYQPFMPTFRASHWDKPPFSQLTVFIPKQPWMKDSRKKLNNQRIVGKGATFTWRQFIASYVYPYNKYFVLLVWFFLSPNIYLWLFWDSDAKNPSHVATLPGSVSLNSLGYYLG